MIGWLVAALLLLAPAAAAAQTVLGNAANAMAVGTWAQFNAGATPGWNSGAITQGDGGGICTMLQYQGKAVWNTAANRYQVVGGVHTGSGCPGPSYGTIYYDDASSAWGRLANPNSGEVGPVHIFDANAMLPDGTHIVSLYNDERILKLAPNGSGSWSVIATVPTQSTVPVADSNIYFPEYPGGGKIIHATPAWGIWTIDPASGATICIAQTQVAQSVGPCVGKPSFSGFGDHNPGSIYSPLCHCVLIGSAGVWIRLDSSGAFTNMSQSGGPGGYGTGGSDDNANSQYMLEPVSGKILNISNGIGGAVALREFDPTNGATGTWRTVMTAGQMPSAIAGGGSGQGLGATGLACTGVPRYGVVMCIKTDGQNWAGGTVWLYKHAPSTPRATPGTPGSLAVR